MWGNSIAARVNRVIKQRAADAQKEHDAMCKQIDKDSDRAKEAHAADMVNKVLGIK